MKRLSVILICLSFIFIFSACSRYNDESESTPAASPTELAVEQENKDSQNKTEVIGKATLYEGTYTDQRCFLEDGDTVLNHYFELDISNITDTSFDFTVYDVNGLNGDNNRKVYIVTNTALFIDDGMKAAFYGKDYTLNFTFPNYHNAEPIVTDIEISGFEPLEGQTYVNNGIPGHEFS